MTTSPKHEMRVHVDWRIPLAADHPWDNHPRELGGVVVSPAGDLLVTSSKGWVYRVDPSSGEPRWSVPLDGAVEAPAVIAGSQVLLGTDVGELLSLDWRTGQTNWRFATRGSVESTATIAGGVAYFFDSNDVLYAVDINQGELLWEYYRGTPEFFTIKGSGSPLVETDVIYAGFADGVIAALSRAQGEVLWEAYLGDDSGEFGDIDLPIVADRGRLFTASHAGGVYALEQSTGAILWHLPVDGVVALEYLDGFLVGATATGRVFALAAGTGEPLWNRRLHEEVSPMGIAQVNGLLALPVAQGPMYWLRLRDGFVVTRWNPGPGFQRAPVFDGERGYALSNRGFLYGFRLAM